MTRSDKGRAFFLAGYFLLAIALCYAAMVEAWLNLMTIMGLLLCLIGASVSDLFREYEGDDHGGA